MGEAVVAAAEFDRGEPAALITLAYERYVPELTAYVAQRFGTRLTPEDVVHEAFARLVREAAAGRLPDQTRPWLYRVAHNIAVSDLRRPSASATSIDEPGVPEPVASSAECEYEGRVVDLDLQRAFRSLPLDRRTVLLMAADGYSGREIARAVGRSELATRTLLCRSRRAVRELLDGTGDDALGRGRRPAAAACRTAPILMSA